MTNVDRSPGVRNHFVYRAYDADGRLLYVGRTYDLKKRWGQHQYENTHWTVRTARLKQSGPYDFPTARDLERKALETEHPEFGWTPARGRAMNQRRQWERQRRNEILAGRKPTETDVAHLWKVIDQASREADLVFPGIANSTNKP